MLTRMVKKLLKSQKAEADSDSDSDSNSEAASKKASKKEVKKPEPMKTDEGSDDSSEDEATPSKKTKAAAKKEADSDDLSDDSDSEDESAKAKKKAAKKVASDDSNDESSSDDESEKKPTKKADDSDSSSDDSDKSDEDKPPATPVKDNKRKNTFGDGSSPKKGRPEGQSKYGGTKTELKGKTARVFVGNLSYDIDDDKVKEFFKEIGELSDIYWLTDRDSGDFRGAGFLTFESNEIADKAVEEMAGKDLMGRALKIDWAEERNKGGRKKSGFVPDWVNNPLSERPDNCYTVFLGNLDFNITEDDVKKHFKDCGELKSIRWMQKDGEFKGAGFAEFTTTEGVDAAVKLCGKEIVGRAARVDYAKPRAPIN